MNDRHLFPIFVCEGRSRSRFKVGYIDQRGHIAIEPIFEDGTRFYEGLASVQLRKKWGVINNAGEFVIQPTLPSYARFHEGLASLSVKGLFGIIDREGAFVLQPSYDYVGPFMKGLALVRRGEMRQARYGYVNKEGREVISAVFHDACSFSEGLAAAKVGGVWGYIMQSGVFKIPPRFEGSRLGVKRTEDTHAGYFVNGLAPVWLGNAYGFVDATGQVVIDGSFAEANSFREERALIELRGRCGFIDSKGNAVIEPRFTLARDFSEGLARVETKEPQAAFSPPSGFIDPDGNMVIDPKFRSANSFQNGLCFVETDDSIGYINRRGEFVWQVPYVDYGVVI